MPTKKKMGCVVSGTSGAAASAGKDAGDGSNSEAQLKSGTSKLCIRPSKLKEIAESKPGKGKGKRLKCNSNPCTSDNGEDDEVELPSKKVMKSTAATDVAQATDLTNTTNLATPITFTNDFGTFTVPAKVEPSFESNYISGHAQGAATCVKRMETNLRTTRSIGNISCINVTYHIPNGPIGSDTIATSQGYYDGWAETLRMAKAILEMTLEERGERTCRECGERVVHGKEATGERKCGGPLAKAGYMW